MTNIHIVKKWKVALRAVDDTWLDMEVYFAVLDDGMLELGNRVYKELFK